MSTLDELITPMTLDEARESVYAGLAAAGANVTLWKAGAPTRTIVAALAIVVYALSAMQAAIAKSGFLLHARGSWLTVVAKYVYDVDRDLGAFATGTLTLNNSAGGVYSYAAGTLTFSNGSKTYKNTAAVTVNALQTGVLIAIQADELGSASTTAANTITTLVTPLPGVTCTNAAALVGFDEESDELLVARSMAKTGSLSPNGPKDAYRYFATSTPRADGTSIGVNRVLSVADGAGGVAVYVATPSGAVTGTEGNPATDLGAIAAAIWQNAEPLSVTAHLYSATLLDVAVTYALVVRDSVGKTNAQIQAAVTAALTTYLAGVPIGGFTGSIDVESLKAVIGSAVGVAYLISVSVTVPSVDVVVATTQAPRLGTETVSITQLPVGVL